MSTLNKCKNCGKLVSSELFSCIHCEAIRCSIRGQLDKGRMTSPDEGSRIISVCLQCSQDINSAKLKQNTF